MTFVPWRRSSPSLVLLGQRADRKLVGLAESGSPARYALCNAPGGDGRGDRLDELL